MRPAKLPWRSWLQASTGIGMLCAMGVFLLCHTVARAAGFFGPPELRPLVLASFLLLWTSPFLLLDKTARAHLGLRKMPSLQWTITSCLIGSLLALGVYWSARILFGDGALHPFTSVKASYFSGVELPVSDRLGLFLLFTVPALIFSPVGEEFFCRGVIVSRAGTVMPRLAAALLAATIFASLHLMHHGFVETQTGLRWLFLPSAMWFIQMLMVSLTFSILKVMTSTIWAAVLSHAAFNFVMNWIIFFI